MLLKRIDLGSQPFGLAIAGEDIVKGSAVVVRNVGGVLKAFLPTTEAEANSVIGFATFRIENVELNDKDYDVIKSGKRLVIYTLVKDNMWATTRFVGTPADDADLVVDFSAGDKGKLRIPTAAEVTANRKTQFRAYRTESGVAGLHGHGYEEKLINVFVK